MVFAVGVRGTAGILLKGGVKIAARVEAYRLSYIAGGQVGLYEHFANLVKTLVGQVFRDGYALALLKNTPNVV